MDTDTIALRTGPPRGGGWARRRSGRVAGSPVLRVVVRRLLLGVPLLFVVSALSFGLISLTPGDPAAQIIGGTPTPAQIAQVRHQLGLDQPVYAQYWHWLGHAVHGDLGASLLTQEPVSRTISQRFPVTLSLILLSELVIVLVGVGFGVLSAVRGGVLGRIVDSLSLIGFALPPFWVGAVLIAVFAVGLRLLPAIGYVPLAQSPGNWARSLVLPVVALAVSGVAVLAKQTREAMLDVLASEHVRMAVANGIPPRLIFFRLALKNASMRVVTIVGLQMVGLLVGTLFVEQVFALPGLGNVFAAAASQGDMTVVQGITVFFTAIIVLINLAVDVAYTALDPRVRAS